MKVFDSAGAPISVNPRGLLAPRKFLSWFLVDVKRLQIESKDLKIFITGLNLEVIKKIIRESQNHTSMLMIKIVCVHFSAAPDESLLPSKTARRKNGNYVMEFCPSIVGRHLAHIHLNNQPMKSSPYIVNVFDPNQVSIQNSGQGILGQPTSIDGKVSICSFETCSFSCCCLNKFVVMYSYSEHGTRWRGASDDAAV